MFGDIVLTKVGRSRCVRHLKFHHPKNDIPLSATLMSSFNDLGFTTEEKTKLTQEYRKHLRAYQHVKNTEIKKAQKELIGALKKLKEESVVIKANDFGAFICLAAIFSGELPSNVDWRFEFEEFALPLFPENLIKNKAACQSFDIALKYSSKSWISLFPSLRRVPAFMGPKFDPDIEEFRLSA
ncbi:MAG: hypothetical protein NXH75_02420 [Halobacteriovoraceae bacterium]|nr:hypothetical protein [Halobacteriovoraceae bacterium]